MTNKREDRWGGSWENRMRFPLEVVRRVRKAVSADFLLIFRIAAMDMLEGGMSWDEVVSLGKALEAEGVNVISTHFCWHESYLRISAGMKVSYLPLRQWCQERPLRRSQAV